MTGIRLCNIDWFPSFFASNANFYSSLLEKRSFVNCKSGLLIVRSSFADSKSFSFIARTSLINCKFVHWFNEVRSLIVTRSLKVNVHFGRFRRP